LKIQKQLLDDHQMKLTVEVDADQMEAMKKRAARKISKQVKIPGFRPGKAPYPVIVRQIGEGVIVEEALEILVDDIYPQIIKEADIKPYGPGSLEKVESLDPPVLEIVVPLEAEVDLGDYRSIRKPYELREITEDDVDDVLQDLCERQAIIEPVDRPAQEGDLVAVRLSAKRLHPEEDQDPIIIKERSVPLIIHAQREGKGEEDEKDWNAEWPFQGFSQNLVGLSTNDEKSIQYIFPEDAEETNFSGVEAEFTWQVESVKERTLPELNDSFVSSMGDFENLDIFRENIRETLESQSRKNIDREYNNEILEQAVQQASFKYPPQMLENEIDQIVDELKNNLDRQNLDLDLYLKTRNLDMVGLRDELTPQAEQRLRSTVFLLELARAEDIQIAPEEINDETENTIRLLKRTLPEKEAQRLNDKDVLNNLIGNVVADLLIKRSMERLQDICSGRLEIDNGNDSETLVSEESLNEEKTDSDSISVEKLSYENQVNEKIAVTDSIIESDPKLNSET